MGEFRIDSLTALIELPRYNSIVMMVCCLMVMIVLMASIRESSMEDNKDYDRRPSVKFYKSKYFSSTEPLSVAACLAFIQVLAVVNYSSALDLELQIKASIATFRPNVKPPKAANHANWRTWVNGDRESLV